MIMGSINRREFLRTAAIGTVAMAGAPWLKPGISLGAGKTLSVAIPDYQSMFDPLNQNSHDNMLLSQVIFENLVEVDVDGNPVPMLAVSLPKISDDKLIYSFDLRDDVYFQNGQKFTAEDVKYSYDYMLDPANKAFRRAVWEPIKEVVVESPTRVSFKLKTPYRPMLQYMTKYMGIFPKGSREKYGDKFFHTGPVEMGTGPGIFVEARSNDYVEFKRNPRYWRKGVPDWDRLIVRIIPEDAVRVAYLMTNQVQIISAPPPASFERLKNMPGFKGDARPALGSALFIATNNQRAPFDDINFRKAVSFAIDRKKLSKQVFYSLVEASALPSPPSAWWFTQEANDMLDFNKDKAKEYLQKSKYASNAEFEMLMPAQPYLIDVRDAAVVVQSMLADIGIKVNMRLVNSGELIGNFMLKGQHVGVLIAFMAPVDPTYLINNTLTPGSVVGKTSGYDNPALKAALDDSYRFIDKAELKKVMDRINMILAEDCPLVWLGSVDVTNLWRDEVKGFKVNSGLTMRVRDVTLG